MATHVRGLRYDQKACSSILVRLKTLRFARATTRIQKATCSYLSESKDTNPKQTWFGRISRHTGAKTAAKRVSLLQQPRQRNKQTSINRGVATVTAPSTGPLIRLKFCPMLPMGETYLEKGVLCRKSTGHCFAAKQTSWYPYLCDLYPLLKCHWF